MSSQELAMNTSNSNIFVYSDKLESFGLVDGPGVRSILFISGCPLKCIYCHNPEMQNALCGEKITPLEAYNKLIRYKAYWGKNGGVTVSGGEPLLHIDFLIELGKLLKKDGINYVIDTSCATFENTPEYLKKFDELLSLTDLFLLDMKGLNPELHKKITGKDNKNILDCYEYLNKKKFPIWIRYVLLPGYTDDKDVLIKTSKYLKQFDNIERLEVLPYHALAIPKYQKLHIEYKLMDVKAPNKDEIELANNLIDSKYFDKYLKKGSNN